MMCVFAGANFQTDFRYIFALRAVFPKSVLFRIYVTDIYISITDVLRFWQGFCFCVFDTN